MNSTNEFTRNVILAATDMAATDTILEASRLCRMQGHEKAANALLMQLSHFREHARANTAWADKLWKAGEGEI